MKDTKDVGRQGRITKDAEKLGTAAEGSGKSQELEERSVLETGGEEKTTLHPPRQLTIFDIIFN